MDPFSGRAKPNIGFLLLYKVGVSLPPEIGPLVDTGGKAGACLMQDLVYGQYHC
jgi:hypothetical protein